MWTRVLLVIACATMPLGVASGDHADAGDVEGFSQGELQRVLKSKIEGVQELAGNELLVQAVRRHNRRELSLEEIQEIDREWASSKEMTPLKKSLQECEVGRYFKSMVGFNSAIYSEAFATDRRGVNIAAYPATTDYWQGDEQKWIEAFNEGSGKVYVGPMEFDESTETDAIQIAVPVMDEAKAIGVLIVGVKLTYLQSRYLQRD